jgi:eukaryotic-like serine/threonine-protein kinase
VDGALALSAAASEVLHAESPTLSREPSISESTPLGPFAHYDLLEEIARGGMGVVYKARDRNLGRIVAVKMILAGSLAGKEFVQRFRAESAAAAVLQHPNIVAIHEVGVHEGRHYFSMDYVEGQDLGQLVGRQPLPPGKSARYVELVGRAIHYAHERGILHRDLKPSNVLIGLNDQPRVTDFGLAKRLNQSELEMPNLELTVSGQVLGSPNFMPPEQAGGKRGNIGRPSDVYALGAILYYLLTARAPFQAESLEQVIMQVLHGEPVSPRLLNPSVPRDLETITLKCLEKEPARRYPTAQELADELSRFQRHEPIKARPITPPEKLWRWCRRKPAFAGAVGFACAAILAGFATTTWQWHRAEGNAVKERHERVRAETGESNVLRQLYIDQMNLAQAAWEQNNVSRVQQLLEETTTAGARGFEWYYWQRQLHQQLSTLRGHTHSVLAIAYAPDGRRIVTGSADKTARVWDAATGNLQLLLEGHTDVVRSVAFSPDGRRILTGSWDGTAMLWDAASGKVVQTLRGHDDAIFSVAFSPDGQRIVTGSRDLTARVWDHASGQELFSLEGHRGVIWSVAFSPDGGRIVTGSWDQTAKVWSATDGINLLTFKGHDDAIFAVAFSPDGRRIATGSRDLTAKVWEAATGHQLFTLSGHGGRIFSVSFSPDGQRIATAGDDQTARVWDAGNRNELLAVKRHGSRISSVAFSPDGQRLITGGGSVSFSPNGEVINPDSGDQTVRVWEAANETELVTLKGHGAPVGSVAFSPDGRHIVTSSFDQTAKVWETASGRKLFTLEGHTAAVRSAAFSPDGQRIVTGSFDRTAKIWDLASRKELFSLTGHQSWLKSVAFSPDGRRIVTASDDGTAMVWNAANGERLLTLKGRNIKGHTVHIWSAAFSPDGRRIVTGYQRGDQEVTVWDAVSGEALLEIDGQTPWVFSVAFSPDGQRIVTGSDDHTAKVWEASSGKHLLTLKGHSGGIMSVNVSPDGRRIVTGSQDQTAKVWDATSGQELLTFKHHKEWILSVAFSPDGQRIVTGSGDRTAKVWEAATAEQVARWRIEDQAVAATTGKDR